MSDEGAGPERAVPESAGDEAQPKARRRKRASEASAAPQAHDAPLREGVPAFAARFPPDPELDRLLVAFEAGDYATVRSGAARLADHATDDAVRASARELRSRLDPDPIAKYLLGAAAALLAVLAAHYFANPHVP